MEGGRNRDVLLFRAVGEGGRGGGPQCSLLRNRDVLFFRAVCVCVPGCVCADSLDVLLSSFWWP